MKVSFVIDLSLAAYTKIYSYHFQVILEIYSMQLCANSIIEFYKLEC